ncbi:S8 family serine peptidase [Methylomonas rapida]|uniref:S8 family serine peptidase n=1 Tax=Methylomonas rapida TaxID=2963939 RepID=A0ABY7GQ36_9GAMM|nr:S8 family serine peptidase [Methylomonas rapida]WAR46617.1 S8 family serine peptidase [Methylomonas rapida]
MMKKSLYIAILAILAVPAGLYVTKYLGSDIESLINQDIGQQPPAAGPVSKTWKSGQILVKPKAGLSDEEFDKVLKGNQGKVKEKIGKLRVHIISVPENAEEAVVKALSKNPRIEFAELDMAVEMSATVPNDPKYASAWHLPKIQVTNAWDVSKADGINIAILDTGVDAAHPDLAAKLIPGWNAVDGGADTSDINGHGTAVAGTAAALTNNAAGVAGIAWNANIIPVRITNDPTGYAYFSDITRGLSWAADNGADVANISFGVSNSSTVSTAAQYLRSKGGVVVTAAGNSGVDPAYADNPYMISVSATDSKDAKASWSNYGAYVDVAAPGVSILTTSRGGAYGNWNGTSFSSPATAGVVALIMAANPNLTPDEVEKVLEASAVKVAGVDFHPYFGYGRVDAAAAVQLALNTTAADTQAPNVAIFSPNAGTVVNGLVQVDVSAADNVSVDAVSFYANGKLVGTDDIAPYQFSWDTTAMADGTVSLTATATDGAGNEGASTAVSVTVQNQAAKIVADQAPPTVAISNPSNAAKVSGIVPVAVAANDDVAVAKVQLYIDGKLVSSTTNKTLTYNWNTKKVAAGSHAIKAVATDTASKTSEMAITVTR